MSGVFRELCVVLSDEAMAIAKGLAEAAVSQAVAKTTWRPSKEARLLEVLRFGTGQGVLCARYGWKKFVINRNALNTNIDISARLHCGHTMRLAPIDETVLCAAPHGEMLNNFIVAIDRCVDEAKRCYCVPREAQP